MRDAHEIIRLRHVVVARLAEMAGIDARREGMDVHVLRALGLVETEPAGKDDIAARINSCSSAINEAAHP